MITLTMNADRMKTLEEITCLAMESCARQVTEGTPDVAHRAGMQLKQIRSWAKFHGINAELRHGAEGVTT